MAETENSRNVVVEKLLTHRPEKVWRALTNRELIAVWLMESDFAPVIGHRFSFRAAPAPNWNGVTDCEVLEIVPGRRLSYRWASSGDEAGRLNTVVTFTLTPAADGTLLRVEQAGFGPDAGNFIQGATWGWNRFTGELAALLDRD